MAGGSERRTRTVLAIAVALACLAGVVAINAAVAAPRPGDLLPDLVADPVTDVVLSTDSSGAQDRLLLRFAGYIHNDGAGALEIRASRGSTGQPMSVVQRLFDGAGAWHDDPSPAQVVYETGDGHVHWHLMHAARYSLWDAARAAEVAPAMKVGFCLEDSERTGSQGPPSDVYGGTRNHRFCEQGNPDARSVFQGVSAGWRDRYSNSLAFQWVDASDVRPGSYWIRTDVDPDGVVVESAEANSEAWGFAPTTIPGYVAQPVQAQTQAATSIGVLLSAASFGAPGQARYRVESAPANGTLDLAVGATRSSPAVSYTPRAGFSGVDSFTYSISDAASAFPRTPARATATVLVGAAGSPSVQISGAPASLVAGTSVQLQATVTGDAPGVTWSVDGAPGGSAASGTVSAQGLYQAPAQTPSGGSVLIGARSGSGASAEHRLQITPAPAPQPAPLPAPAVGSPPGSGVASEQARGTKAPPVGAPRSGLGPLRAHRVGRWLVLTVVPRRAGVVRLRAFARGELLGSCSTRSPAGRPFACRLPYSGLPSSTRIAAVASLRAGGKVVAVKRRRAAVVPHGHGTH